MEDDSKTLNTATLDTETGPDFTVEALARGTALTLEDTYPLTSMSRTRVILLAGAPDCGKTTLIASLFHSFQNGALAGYEFSGSQTLLGFDERCHDARISSRRLTPTMPRTKTGVPDVALHLSVTDVKSKARSELLFLDVSGEQYDSVRDSVDECQHVPCLRRADHVALLIDGERLSDTSLRQRAKSEALLLLRSCFDSDVMRPNSLVDVIITKWDLIHTSPKKAEIEQFVSSLETTAIDKFTPRCARLRFIRIAARPSTTALPLTWGIENLFHGWVNDLPENFYHFGEPTLSEFATEFDRFSILA